jgi:hypothetical protein
MLSKLLFGVTKSPIANRNENSKKLVWKLDAREVFSWIADGRRGSFSFAVAIEYGLGIGDWGLGFGVWGVGCGLWGFRVQGFRVCS